MAVDIIAIVLLISGLLSSLVSAIGVIRLPDYFTRLHAMSIGETLGLLMIGVGLALYGGFEFTGLKVVLTVVLVYIGNPIGNNALGRAACKAGYMVWTNENRDIWNRNEEAEKLFNRIGLASSEDKTDYDGVAEEEQSADAGNGDSMNNDAGKEV